MLERLRIQDYAIIADLETSFSGGLTTITGETGAGKSILLGALKLALGERASSEVVRSGAARALVEAEFRETAAAVRHWLDEAGLTDEDEPERILFRREASASGVSRGFINGRSVTVAQMRELGEQLVAIHAQNEHTTLFVPGVQLRLLDDFGGHATELSACASAHAEFRAALAKMRALQADEADMERRKAFLMFQVEELDRARLSPGEDEALENERRRLVNAERLLAACASAADMLYEGEQTESPAAALLGAAAKGLAEVAALDNSQQALAKQAEELRFGVEDLAARIREYMAGVNTDPARLSLVEERLELIRGLKKKYGGTIAEMLATRERLAAELDQCVHRDEALATATATAQAAAEALLSAAAALRTVRLRAAKAFQQRIESEMRPLELPKASFQVALLPAAPDDDQADVIAKAEAIAADGADTVEFLVALNPGEESRPLRRVASGGEIARIMLAVKSVLAGRDSIPTLIFDEIDIGISGEAATRVGEKLKRLAASHQVICITHLPQIAACGDQHLRVSKSVTGGRTRVHLETLSGEDRAAAIAEMITGKAANPDALRLAERLLARNG
ncbi:MAG: DNA repair protein RecN [Candidatus Sumerlaeaceae bacterium]|nr:DNA repair protein RecN [Candidatus Sumerlaeaceae bacterium]